MKVRCSTTPNDKEAETSNGYVKLDGEKLTDMPNWNDINWHSVEMHIIRLQVRITKAVIKLIQK